LKKELTEQERIHELKEKRKAIRQQVAGAFKDLRSANYVKKGNKTANVKY
jgi:hypothetical protein